MKKTTIILLTAIAMCFMLTACECEHQYSEAITLEATCTTVGIKTYTCTLCEESYTEEIPIIAHQYGEPYTSQEATCRDKEEKTQECVVCGDKIISVGEYGEHKYGEWEVFVKPTYEAAGQELHKCETCQNQEFRLIPMLEPVVIELTKDNFKDYFDVSCYISNYYKETTRLGANGYTYAYIGCSPKVVCNLQDVKVTVKLSPHGGIWDGASYDAVTFSVSAKDQEGGTTQKMFIFSTSSSRITKPDYVSYYLIDVKGTITLYPEA